MRVLIVDDDDGCRRMLCDLFESREAETVGAATSDQAIDTLRVENSELSVLCDGLDGQWIGVWSVAVKRGKKFALLSGDLELVERARKIGVRAFQKPQGMNAAIAFLLDSR